MFSIKHLFTDYLKYMQANFRAYQVYKMLKTLNVKLVDLQTNYIFVGNLHLEINTFGGVLIYETHRLADTAPYIIAVDKNPKLVEDLNVLLQDYLLFADNQPINITTQNPTLINNLPFASVALNLALEEFSTLTEIENFIQRLLNIISPNAVVFGFSYLPLHQFKHSAKAKAYINNKINQKHWFNKQYLLDDLETMLYKYFDDVEILIYGSVFTFKLSKHYVKPDFSKIKLTVENAGNKYIEVKPINNL